MFLFLLRPSLTGAIIDKKGERKIRPFIDSLFTKVKARDDVAVLFNVVRLDIVQKSPALTDHFQKAAAGMVVVRVRS